MPAAKHALRKRKTGQFVKYFPLREPGSSKIRRAESFSTRDKTAQRLQNPASISGI
jgi:hypothetical protein